MEILDYRFSKESVKPCGSPFAVLNIAALFYFLYKGVLDYLLCTLSIADPTSYFSFVPDCRFVINRRSRPRLFNHLTSKVVSCPSKGVTNQELLMWTKDKCEDYESE